jgi:uncharacterized membrane protein
MTVLATRKTGGVPSNYAILLAGLFFFPVQIVAMLFSKRRRFEADAWEITHYEMQYRTAAAYFIVQAALFVIGIIALFLMRGQGPEAMSFRTLWPLLSAVGYLPIAWLVVRCVRGLFLSGGKKALKNPRSYTVWPR